MEKYTYYVSVQAGTIMENQGDAPYEFEIEATEDEANRLYALFENQMETDHDAYIRAMTPIVPYHHDNPNDKHDQSLQAIYSTIYQLGTLQTKRHIKAMGILK